MVTNAIQMYKLVYLFEASETEHVAYEFNPNDAIALFNVLKEHGPVKIFKYKADKDGNAVSEVPMVIRTETVLEEAD